MSGLNFNDTDNKAFTKSLVFSESNSGGAVVRNMTITLYPNGSMISINPSTSSNNVTYNLPTASAASGFKYNFFFNANAGTSVIVKIGPNSDVAGGFIHTSDDALASHSGISKVVFGAATAKQYDMVEFFSDGSKWYYKVHHQGTAAEVTVEAAG